MIDEPDDVDESEDPEAHGDRLTPQEVDAELRKLAATPADWSRLRSISSFLSGGLADFAGDDLLQETVTRFFEGRRTWPRNVHPIVVLKNAMRSVASDARKHGKLDPVDRTVALAGGPEDDDDCRPRAEATVDTTPEDELAGKEQLAAVYAAVAGDEDLEWVVLTWADGLRGDDAVRELGWEKKKYEAARKRLTRRLDTLDPDRRSK